MPYPRATVVLVLAAAAAGNSCSRADARDAVDASKARVRQAATGAANQIADAWLTVKIATQYLADDDIEARRVNVSTRDRVVTLSGHVAGAAEREQAVTIARNTDGVRHVDDRLEVPAHAPTGLPLPIGTAGADRRTDPAVGDDEVAQRIRARYDMDPMLARRRLEIASRGEVVTLSGIVGSEEERAHAIRLAHGTPGVERVEDMLSVQPGIQGIQ